MTLEQTLNQIKNETLALAKELQTEKASKNKVEKALKFKDNKELYCLLQGYCKDLEAKLKNEKSSEGLNVFKDRLFKECEQNGKTKLHCSPLTFVIYSTYLWIADGKKYSFEIDIDSYTITAYVNFSNFENKEINGINNRLGLNIPLNRETLDKTDEWLESFDELEKQIADLL